MYAFIELEPILVGIGRSLSLFAVTALAWLYGCSAEKANTSLDQLYRDYDRGHYAQTLATAAQIARTAREPSRHEAAYLAGLSAYRMQNRTSAARYLRIAQRSPDSAIAGDALAVLGLVRNEQGRHEQANRAFLAAADHLKGEDKTQAVFYAAAAQQKMGATASARSIMDRAKRLTRNPGLRDRVGQKKTRDVWTIQTGAFSIESHARREVVRVNHRSTGTPWGEARVVPTTNNSGHRLLLVQIGRFSSYNRALMARSRLGLSGAYLVPLSRAISPGS